MSELQAYKEMYLKMVRASEKAMEILIEAQQACEELYLCMENWEEKQQNG